MVLTKCELSMTRLYDIEKATIESARAEFRATYTTQGRNAHQRTVPYPENMLPLPAFHMWIQSAVQNVVSRGAAYDANIRHLCKPPGFVARSFWSMWAYGNHYRVVETGVVDYHVTFDSGVAQIFAEESTGRGVDGNPVMNQLQYVGVVREILQLQYGAVTPVVFICEWVRASLTGRNRTMKKDEYGFLLVDFDRMLPPGDEPFTFPWQVEQVFFADEPSNAGNWKVVLQKEPRSRRVVHDVTGVSLGENESCVRMQVAEALEDVNPNTEFGPSTTLTEAEMATIAMMRPPRRDEPWHRDSEDCNTDHECSESSSDEDDYIW